MKLGWGSLRTAFSGSLNAWQEPCAHDFLTERPRIIHRADHIEAWTERVCSRCNETEIVSGPVVLG